jgi:hypothetical protein
MRLLNSQTLQPKEFVGDANIPPYAILSHTWGKEEVLLKDMLGPTDILERKEGFKKIKHCCAQARTDRLDWVWVDT